MSGPAQVKYGLIQRLKIDNHSINRCCELFKVSCSGFYAWIKRPLCSRDKRDSELKKKIKTIFEKSKKCYGSPRVQKSLCQDGQRVGKNRVARLMREEGLSARKKKAYKPKTTLSNPNEKKSPRVFKIEDCNLSRENKYWASDLSYLETESGFCYLVVVMDLFNRQIKGWDVSDSMEASNTQNAFLNAVQGESGALVGLVFHSDQGSQFSSLELRKKFEILDVTQSMSRKGNCYDNAFVESFFHTLKNELEKTKFKDLKEAKKMIFEYMNWYNRERLHSSLGYLSPMDYVNQPTARVA